MQCLEQAIECPFLRNAIDALPHALPFKQAEESYISADDFCRAVGQEPAAVLQNEVTLLLQLRFDLVVRISLSSLAFFLLLSILYYHC